MSAVEFDMSAISDWADKVKGMLESERDAFLEDAANMLAGEFLTRVKRRTPIGEYGDYVEFTTNPRNNTKEVSFTAKDGKGVFLLLKTRQRLLSLRAA